MKGNGYERNNEAIENGKKWLKGKLMQGISG